MSKKLVLLMVFILSVSSALAQADRNLIRRAKADPETAGILTATYTIGQSSYTLKEGAWNDDSMEETVWISDFRKGVAGILVVLFRNFGGSGTDVELILLDKKFRQIDRKSMGDRAIVQSIRVSDFGAVVIGFSHGDEDPFCCPTKPVRVELLALNPK